LDCCVITIYSLFPVISIINYIGSKHRLFDFIKTTVKEVCGDDLSQKTFCDLFAGTSSVGRNFKPIVNI